MKSPEQCPEHGGAMPGALLGPAFRMPAVAAAVLLLVFSFAACGPGIVRACSAFSVSTEAGVVTAKNMDRDDEFPGAVLVNPRGVEKTAVPWRGWWPVRDSRPAARWVCGYGSVTFSCWGRDFIAGGMNEAGLVVEQAGLTSEYAPDDGRPGVSCAQWMQYQLDNFATVAEFVEQLDDLRPDGRAGIISSQTAVVTAPSSSTSTAGPLSSVAATCLTARSRTRRANARRSTFPSIGDSADRSMWRRAMIRAGASCAWRRSRRGRSLSTRPSGSSLVAGPRRDGLFTREEATRGAGEETL